MNTGPPSAESSFDLTAAVFQVLEDQWAHLHRNGYSSRDILSWMTVLAAAPNPNAHHTVTGLLDGWTDVNRLAMHQWQRLGPLAPMAVAARLSYIEARACATAGLLTEPLLHTLAVTHGWPFLPSTVSCPRGTTALLSSIAPRSPGLIECLDSAVEHPEVADWASERWFTPALLETLATLTGWARAHGTAVGQGDTPGAVFWLLGHTLLRLVGHAALPPERALGWVAVAAAAPSTEDWRTLHRLIPGQPPMPTDLRVEMARDWATWQIVSDRGPLAYAAGLNPSEAASGRVALDEPTLRAMAGLRGWPLPPTPLPAGLPGAPVNPIEHPAAVLP